MASNHHNTQPVVEVEDTERRWKFLVNGKGPFNFYGMMAEALGEGCEGLIRELYVDKEMSTIDIAELLTEVFDLKRPITESQVNRLLKKCHIERRNYAERKRVAWKKGKLDESMRKTRLSLKKAYAVGSTFEESARVRIMLDLDSYQEDWDIVIGYNVHKILSRYEVDIPVVVHDPRTGKACRFAVEIDTPFTHGDLQTILKDERKSKALAGRGWYVLRAKFNSTNSLDFMKAIKAVTDTIWEVSKRSFQANETDGSKPFPTKLHPPETPDPL